MAKLDAEMAVLDLEMAGLGSVIFLITTKNIFLLGWSRTSRMRLHIHGLIHVCVTSYMTFFFIQYLQSIHMMSYKQYIFLLQQKIVDDHQKFFWWRQEVFLTTAKNLFQQRQKLFSTTMKIFLFDNDKRFLVTTRDVTAQDFPTVAITGCKRGLL